MPIVRLNNKVVYFSHIPKCGGTSVENFLKIITGADLSFLDRNFFMNKNVPWSIASPQHITGNDVSKFFPITFFDEFFTVTRHPFDRFCSAFIFQKYYFKTMPQEDDINNFIANLDEHRALNPGRFDNHFLPQVNFLYPGATYRVFKLENGLDDIKKYISSIFGIDAINIPIPHSLKTPNQLKINVDSLTDNSKKIIKEIYKLDFKNFNY